MANFNAGTNQLPQANSLKQSPYSVRCRLKAGETTSIPYAVYEIDSYDDEKFEFVVKRPTADNILHAQLLIGQGHKVPAEGVFMASQATDAILVAGDTGQTIVVGDDVGTQEDSYKLKSGNTGLKALDYDSTDGLILARPSGGTGGTSTPLQLVQVITSSASSGNVTVKNIQLTTNPDASPNYTAIGDTFNARRLRS